MEFLVKFSLGVAVFLVTVGVVLIFWLLLDILKIWLQKKIGELCC